MPHTPRVTLVLDSSRQPPGGHSFPDSSGHTLRADSIPDLLTAIADYRAKNGLHPGDPYKELEAYYARLYPWLISRVGSVPSAPEDPCLRWLNRQWRQPVAKWVEAMTARRRYAQCQGCPHYVPLHPWSGESRRRLLILGGGKTDGMDGVCKAHHWAVGLACAAENLPTPADVPDCWVTVENADSATDGQSTGR